MADKTDKKLSSEDIRLFSEATIGACLNARIVSEKDASSILIARSRRKATARGTEVPTGEASTFSFVQVGAALNAGQMSDGDAAKILLPRAQRKAERRGTTVPA